MSDASSFGFGKFIPGFDFLQGLAQSAGSATARPLGRLPEWVAPTVSIEEVDKRITELKAVQFWLEQNGKALAATIQALEVQRMTLSTLQGMNVSMGELAQAFQFPAAATAAAAASGAGQAQRTDNSDWPMSAAAPAQARRPEPAAPQSRASEPGASSSAPAAASVPPASEAGAEAAPAQAAAVGQAMQWWSALTQQFQQIAAKAMAEPLAPEAVAAAQRATGMAGDFAKAAMGRMTAQAGKAAAAPAATAAAKAQGKAPAKTAAKAPATAPAKAAAKKTAAKTAAKAPAKAPAARKAVAKDRPAR